jgi:hypothetical protein
MYVLCKGKGESEVLYSEVDYVTLLYQETTDDDLSLKCEACILSVTVLLFCVVYRIL